MRWYFAIDEAGGLGATGADAKTAVRSALAIGGLEPRLLYHGARNDFTAWMERHGVDVIDAAPGFQDVILAGEAAGTYKAHSMGHWLRVVIPQVETVEKFVLYTDCDVMFLKPVAWSAIQPAVFAAAPEFVRDNWNYFNAGVMVLNVPAMRVSYPAFEAHVRARIGSGELPSYDDEFALNEAYREVWTRLDPLLNWKPYWKFDPDAAILHFHGPKLAAIESIATGAWSADNPTATQLRRMVLAHVGFYATWLAHLGDRLQTSDFDLALRMHRTAAALLRPRPKEDLKPADMAFMNFRMFPNK